MLAVVSGFCPVSWNAPIPADNLLPTVPCASFLVCLSPLTSSRGPLRGLYLLQLTSPCLLCQLHPEPAAPPLRLFQSDLGMCCCLDFLESLNATLPVSVGGHTQTRPVIRNIKYSLLEHRQIRLVAMQRKWQGWPKMTGNIKHWKERLKLEDKPFAVSSSRAFYILFLCTGSVRALPAC